MNLKLILRPAILLLFAAVIIIPTQVNAQSRKRGKTTASSSNIRHSNKTISNGSTVITICHYDAPAFYKITDEELVKISYCNGYIDNSFSIDWPISVHNGNVNALQQWLIKKACFQKTPVPRDITSLIKLRNKCDSPHRKVSQIPKTGSSPLSEALDVSITLLSNNILMADMFVNDYYGGGSASAYTYGHFYYYYDIKGYNELESSDFFKPNTVNLIKNYLKKEGISSQGLDPFISKNFLIKKENVTFIYHRGDLVPGIAIDIPISLNDIKSYATPKLLSIIDELQGKTIVSTSNIGQSNKTNGSMASVGTMTVYLAATSMQSGDFTIEPFDRGDFITDSNNPLTRFDSQNKTTYRYTFPDDGDMYSVTVAKSKIVTKQYEMSQLPVSLIGTKAVFKSTEGGIARIFRSSNNGHVFLDKNGKKQPDYVSQRMDGGYVLSVQWPSKYNNDNELFEEQLDVIDGNLQLYMVPKYGDGVSQKARLKKNLVGLVVEKWKAVESWPWGKSSYDSNGRLLTDQIRESSGLISEGISDFSDYCTIAYISDLDALYISGNLFYREKENSSQYNSKETTAKYNGEIYRSVEQMPTFPGGEKVLDDFMNTNIQYPASARKQNLEGRVVVQFVVEKDGSVGEVKVVRSANEDFDREAVRVCKTIKGFLPGRQNGQPVRVWYTMPVNFKLGKK